MNKKKILILASGIINIVIGLSSISDLHVYGLIPLILGFLILLLGMDDKTVSKNKNLLLGISVISLFPSVIPGVLLLLGIHDIKPDIMKQEEIVDPESKKIDILLKLGVGMVFVSGILFATTNWEVITLPIKLIVLILLGLLFQGLSYFAENKLKIKKTSIMYYILSMSFFFTTCIGMCYYGMFGAEVTYIGEQSALAYSITYFYLSVLTIISYAKYKSEGLLYVAYTSVLLGINYLFNATGVNDTYKVLVLSTVAFIFNVILKKDNSLTRFNNIISYIFPFLLIPASADGDLVPLIMASAINIVNTNYLAIQYKERMYSVGAVITSYIAIIFTVVGSDTSYAPVIIVGLSLVQTLVTRLKIVVDDDTLNEFNQIVHAVLAFVLFSTSLTTNDFQPALIGCFYLLGNLLGEIDAKDLKKNYLDNLIRPYALFLITMGITVFINENIGYISYTIACTFLLIVYAAIHKFTYREAKLGYFIGTIAVFILLTVLNIGEKNGLVQLISTLPIGYLFMNSIPEEKTDKTITLYILLLIDIYLSIITFNEYTSINMIKPLVVIAIYLILNYIFKDEPRLKGISDFAVLVPLISEVNQLFDHESFKAVCTNIIELYGLYLIIKYFFKDKTSDRNGIIIAGLVFILLQVIFTTDIVIAIYVGLVGILLIALGYSREDLPVLFKAGIVVTIVNIIFQLRNLWSEIPFSLYLLIGGLGIIGFVTYKEIKKK